MKASKGETSALFTVGGGGPVLRENYRITVEDIEATLTLEGIQEIRPGDVVFIRTRWTKLIDVDPQLFLSSEPGPYLRETRYLAARRPAILGADNFAYEILDQAVTKGNIFPCHQELFIHHGIRIQENVVLDELAEDGVFEFVYFLTPTYAQGAITSDSPPAALGQPKKQSAC
jgi:kynurenine formamidase